MWFSAITDTTCKVKGVLFITSMQDYNAIYKGMNAWWYKAQATIKAQLENTSKLIRTS
jgi:hypothetical protein